MISLHKIVQHVLMNMDYSPLKRFDDMGIHIHATDVIAHFGKAGSCYEPNVACTENAYFHEANLLLIEEPVGIGNTSDKI